MDRSRASADLDARLARLSARRAAADVDGATDVGPRNGRRRRRHPAAATRILVGGLSLSAFLSIIASIGATATVSGASTTGPPLTPVSGIPVATGPQPTTPRVAAKPPARTGLIPLATTTTTAPHSSTTVPGAAATVATTVPRHRQAPGSRSTPPAGPAATPPPGSAAPAPATTPPFTAPHAGQAPATTPKTTPTTAHHAPPTTTPTTVFVPPPPPPPPACYGSRCH